MPPTTTLRRKVKTKAKKPKVSKNRTPLWPANYIPRVIVKFRSDVTLPDEDAVAQKDLYEGKMGPWGRLVERFPGIKIQRLITKLSPQECRTMVDKAKQVCPALHPAKLENYFVVQCPSRKDVQEIARTLDAWNGVDVAYIESGPTRPPAVNRAANLPYGPRQMYLGAAPDGIDAEYAWTKRGSDGKGVDLKLADVEQGWHLKHEDLPGDIELIHGYNRECAHGTAVLGIVVANDDGKGCVGITPYLKTIMVSSIWPDPLTAYPDRYNAILAAINKLDLGDVLLLELQINAQGYYPTSLGGQDGLGWYGNLPAEVEYPLFELIQTATARGIVVVEAAGNGGWDLDAFDPYAAPHWGKDSGAIMVAAVDVPAIRSSYSRFLESNYGSRINCYAWGKQICAPYDETGLQKYATGFGATSGASAILAGAALAVQGFAKANRNRTLPADEMRRILSDPTTGTLSANSTPTNPNADVIGVMPDLRKIIDNL
jgi:serine protease